MAIKTGFCLPHSTLRLWTLLVIVLTIVIILITNIDLGYVSHVFPQYVTSFSASCKAEVSAPPIVLVDAVFPVRIEVFRGNIRSLPRSYATVRFNPGNSTHVSTVDLYYGVGTTNLTISRVGVLQLSVTVETRDDHAPTETCQASVRIKSARSLTREAGDQLIHKLQGPDLCKNCCKTVWSLEFGNYENWIMENIRDMKRASIHPPEFRKLECGMTFSADLYQHNHSDCIVQKVYVKSAYTIYTHGRGLPQPNNVDKYRAFLYIGNCMKSAHSHFVNKETNDYVLIDNDRCLVADRVAGGQRNDVNHLAKMFNKRPVCQVLDDVIHRLKRMNAVSSQVPSLGTQFRMEVESHPAMAPLVLEEDPDIYEEVDGRVSVLVAEYNALCEGNNPDKFDSSLRKVYKTSAITESYLVHGRDYVLAKFADGMKAYLKVVGGEVREDIDGYVFNGGLAELVAYHLDRLLGMGRAAVSAARRLRLDGTVPINGVINVQGEVLEDFSGKRDTLGRYLTESKTTSKSIQWIANQLQKGQHELYHSLNVVVVGKMKSLKDNIELHPQVGEFFNHSANVSELENVGVTRQMLRDLADIFVFHFLIHNPTKERLAMSELRFVSNDNDKAFWPDVSTNVCESILRCPASLQPEEHTELAGHSFPQHLLPGTGSQRSERSVREITKTKTGFQAFKAQAHHYIFSRGKFTCQH
uniref:Uncharacterized protein n=1 Tax=Branchiostoma floridae TaxID=7739 RepID=C3YIS0_BRAFL|eukprot:XP_002603783.1 hypothetical protein BRAFLDRAFT_86613 [Branchiostoma floridae]